MRARFESLHLLVVAGLLTLAVAVPAGLKLAAIPATRPIRVWMMREPSTLPPRAIQLPREEASDGADVFRLSLSSRDVSDLVAHDRIEIVFGTNVTAARLIRGTLTIAGTACAFTTDPDAVLVDNSLLGFSRHEPCVLSGFEPPGSVALEMRLVRRSGTLAVWTFEDASAAARPLYLLDGPLRLSVRGMVSRMPTPFTKRRAELLAYLWDVPEATLWARLTSALLGILAGIWLLQGADRTPTLATRPIAAAGAALLLGGLALGYAVLTPPLQAPDEPDHLVSYAALTEQADIRAELSALVQRTHFDRLRHQAHEQFAETDIGHPLAGPLFDDLIGEPVAMRSPATAWWWRQLHAVVPRASLVGTLWALREGAVLLFGLSAGLAVLLLSYLGDLPRASLACLGFLVIPTLPFFGAHVSDTATIVALNLLLAVALAGLVLDSPHELLLGASLGSAIALVLLSGRRSWPVLAVAGVLLLLRALLGSPRGRAAHLTLAFWAPLLASLGVGVWYAGRLGTLGYALRSPSAQIPGPLAPLVTLLQHPAGLFGPLLLLPIIDRMGGPIRTRLLAWGASRMVRWMGTSVAMAVVVCVALSYWIDLPTARPGAVHTLSLTAYVRAVLTSMAIPFRIGHVDLLLSTLFWSGFGWVDTVAPAWLLALLNGATALAVWWTWRNTSRGRDARRVLLLGAFVVGLAVSLAVSAAGAYTLRYDVYGRYLVAWYVVLVTFLWLPPAAGSKGAWWLWAALPIAAHAYCLQMIVSRYF